MSTEIEAKLKVDSLQPIADKLTELAAEFIGEHIQTDDYFDTTDATLTNADKCLRIRHQRLAETEIHILTFKGPKQQDNFKKRQEIELEVTDSETAQQLLSALGYEKVLTCEKKRQLWNLDQCQIALDELPLLGTFVEIEGPDDSTITEVQKKLRLSNVPHTPKTYAQMLAEKRNKS